MSKVSVLLSTAGFPFEPIDELIIVDEKLTNEELRRAIEKILNSYFKVEY